MTAAPSVTPYAVVPNPQRSGWVMVWVCCPHCGQTHVHGGPSADYTGHRSADCGATLGYHVRVAVVDVAPKCPVCGGSLRPGVTVHPSCQRGAP
ncbi:hypothetical protein GCM10009817_06550 [Terrabacter lapilli]|uniref:Uncharacterized protein n=1 Tax=Terrabacter lapilli TaxID=436231 RepID=A0ABN2RIF3_9MICO